MAAAHPERAEALPPPAPRRDQLAPGAAGEVAVGDRMLRVGAAHGAVADVAQRGDRPQVGARPARVMLVPPPGPELLGRESEIAQALEALGADVPIEFDGPPGVGKTALLRHLAHRAEAVPAGGAVYCRAAGRQFDDVLALIFDAFHEADRPYVPTPSELRLRLQGVSALLLLDDLEAAAMWGQGLVDALPGCSFVVAASRRQLRDDARVVELGGLPEHAALALLQQELGRLLRTEEHDPAQAVCRRVRGRPLGVLQAAAAVRTGAASLAGLADQPVLDPAAEPRWRRVLSALSAVAPAPLSAFHVAAIGELDDPEEVLERLCDRRLVERHGARYALAAPLALDLPERERWTERALRHLAAWAPNADPAAPGVDADALLASLRWGRERGRWGEVLALARVLDPPLALSGQWGSWKLALEAALEAARALGDRAAEGWALNQLGVRAMCRGEEGEARGHLDEGLAVRQEMGDSQGAEVTRHNLEVLGGAPRRPGRIVRGRWPAVLAVIGAGLGGAAGVMLARGEFGGPPPAQTEPAPNATTPGPGGQQAEQTTPGRPGAVERGGAASPGAPAPEQGPPRPDLVVVGARASAVGGCTVSWTVRNRGRANAPPSTTVLRWQLAGGGSGQTSASIPALRPGGSRSVSKPSRGYSCGEFSALTVRVDADGRVRESQERNNQAAARRSG